MKNEMNKNQHIQQLRELGFTGSYRSLKTFENRANRIATAWCNGDIDEGQYDFAMFKVEVGVKRLFNGTMPDGFFINSNPQGYALKIRDTVNTLSQRDWGNYGLLAPDFN